MPTYKVEKRSRKRQTKKPKRPGLYSLLDLKRHEYRLLMLKPGADNEVLDGTLETVHFPDTGIPKGSAPFETMSYAWGDQNIRDTITVNGQLLDIPASAASALRCMRFQHSERSLWIDSVCINQQDVQERAHQVSRMADIYSGAKGNLVHLGDDDDGKARLAFESIERVVREAEHETGGRLKDAIFDENMRARLPTSALACNPDYDAISWLLDRPWFSRLWVVQEYLLSSLSVAYCGNSSISMDRVLKAVAWLQHKRFHSLTWTPLGDASRAFSMYAMQNEAPTITNLLFALGEFDCSDVRDKVFGGIGLYQSEAQTEAQKMNRFQGLPDALTPDYTKDPAHVLRDATRFSIKEDESLTLLAYKHYGGRNRLKGLPTWVPNWYRELKPEDPTNYPQGFFCACYILQQPEIVEHPDPDILSVKGLSFSSVLQLTPTTTPEMLGDIHALASQLQCIRAMSISAQSTTSALAITLVGDEAWYLCKDDGDAALVAWQAFCKHINQKRELPFLPAPPDSDHSQGLRSAVNYRRALYTGMRGRRFFTTAAGQIGTGPDGLEIGDILVILSGGRVPFALRKKGRTFTMVGPVYVHGVMYGELFYNDFRPSPRWKTFNIE